MPPKEMPPRFGNETASEISGEPDPKVLVQIAQMKMPFGRYAGRPLIDLPEPYLVAANAVHVTDIASRT